MTDARPRTKKGSLPRYRRYDGVPWQPVSVDCRCAAHLVAVSGLMDVSLVKTGRSLELELEQVDLAAVAREVVSRFSVDATRAHCSVALRAEVPVVGEWDRFRLDQVVTNLLSNAIKFCAGKPIEVRVEPAGLAGRLAVRDNGIGMAPEDAQRVLRRFERAVSAQAYGGLGLGLCIVSQIVEAHGGTIRLDTQPSAGSTFTVELPREPPRTSKDGRPLAQSDREARRSAPQSVTPLPVRVERGTPSSLRCIKVSFLALSSPW